VAVAIIRQLNENLIRQGVKFVLQAGDLTNDGNPLAIDYRIAVPAAGLSK
jgi:hypothetical protein